MTTIEQANHALYLLRGIGRGLYNNDREAIICAIENLTAENVQWQQKLSDEMTLQIEVNRLEGVQAENVRLREREEQQAATIATLTARITELEQKLSDERNLRIEYMPNGSWRLTP